MRTKQIVKANKVLCVLCVSFLSEVHVLPPLFPLPHQALRQQKPTPILMLHMNVTNLHILFVTNSLICVSSGGSDEAGAAGGDGSAAGGAG